MKRAISVRKMEKGQSLVEFAFGVVFLLILVTGIVDGSRAFFTYMAIRDAAQEGAIYAAVNPSDVGGIQTRVRDSSNMLTGLGTKLTITVTPTVSGKYCAGVTGTTTHGIKVRVVYANFPLTMPIFGALIGAHNQSVPISAEAIDTILIPMCQ